MRDRCRRAHLCQSLHPACERPVCLTSLVIARAPRRGDRMDSPKQSTLGAFRDFAFKGNVVDLAVGVVIGAAFGKIVTGLVDGLIMPLVGLLLPSGHWREFVVHVGR